ncbi:MAG: choice-of-anchor tandem repeat GloVer-containing protein [Terracidiphilus sp.]
MLPALQTQCVAPLEWYSARTGSGTVDDSFVQPCSTGGDATATIKGGPALVLGGMALSIDVASGTYSFDPAVDVSATESITGCGNGSSAPYPLYAVTPFDPTVCGAFWVTRPLPATIGVITESNLTFTAPAIFCAPAGIPTDWTISFTLTPNYTPPQPYADLYSFTAAGPNTFNSGRLAQGRDGNFYGESQDGGSGNGAVFKITSGGTATVLRSFDGTDGAMENGGMTLGADGDLYGDTSKGGSRSQGVTFKITAQGAETVLHDFSNSGDGASPVGALVLGSDGDYYGTTSSEPATFYKVTSAGKLTTLHTLTTAQGYQGGQLIQATDGNFYGGMSMGGGAGDDGTAFKVTPEGVVTVLHKFDKTDGSDAAAGMVEVDSGAFIGTAAHGGTSDDGVIYSLTSAGKFAVVHKMDGPTDGSLPGVLTAGSDGNLYGTSANGGSAKNCGTIFKVTPSNEFTVLYTFDGTHGCHPEGYLTQGTDGKFYGLTNAGGAHDKGVFFSLDMGLGPFASLVTRSGSEGSKVGILGQGFSGSSVVRFGSVAATAIAVTGSTFISATVPKDALTGPVIVSTGTNLLLSPQEFSVLPTITSFTPADGPVRTKVTITGTGLLQTTKVTFGKVAATGVTVKSDTELTADVPAGATTGSIAITTKGGSATSATSFTVN